MPRKKRAAAASAQNGKNSRMDQPKKRPQAAIQDMPVYGLELQSDQENHAKQRVSQRVWGEKRFCGLPKLQTTTSEPFQYQFTEFFIDIEPAPEDFEDLQVFEPEHDT